MFNSKSKAETEDSGDLGEAELEVRLELLEEGGRGG